MNTESAGSLSPSCRSPPPSTIPLGAWRWDQSTRPGNSLALAGPKKTPFASPLAHLWRKAKTKGKNSVRCYLALSQFSIKRHASSIFATEKNCKKEWFITLGADKDATHNAGQIGNDSADMLGGGMGWPMSAKAFLPTPQSLWHPFTRQFSPSSRSLAETARINITALAHKDGPDRPPSMASLFLASLRVPSLPFPSRPA